jgi:GT2 family glycosyltransferase
VTLSASFVLLTTGDRPAELWTAIDSIRDQTINGQIILVCNGCKASDTGSDVTAIELDENVGIPAGRNIGIGASTGEIVFFLDDDGFYPARDTVDRAIKMFQANTLLGIVSFRIVDPEGSPIQRRHVPRLRTGDPSHASQVTTFLGGACAIRRSVFDDVGGFPDGFFYAHEETDLAWRAIDAHWQIRYEPQLAITHPANPPAQRGKAVYLTARNRVFLARRRLPIPLAAVYVPVWFILSMARTRDRTSVVRGFLAGLREPSGGRSPISWRAAYTMTRLGRPPIV